MIGNSRHGHRIRQSFSLASAAVAALSLSIIAAGPVRAQNSDGEVAVGGVHVLTVRFPSGGLSIRERADAVTDRLVDILSDPHLAPQDIYVVPDGKTEAHIMVGRRLLVTVDSATARYNSSRALDLAKIWADHLRQVLPQLNVKPNPNDRN